MGPTSPVIPEEFQPLQSPPKFSNKEPPASLPETPKTQGLKNAFKEPTLSQASPRARERERRNPSLPPAPKPSSRSQVTTILEAMAMARHTYDEAYKAQSEI